MEPTQEGGANMTHEEILRHNSGVLFAGQPGEFIGYDEDTNEGETVQETLDRARAMIDLIEQAAGSPLVGDAVRDYIKRQLQDLRVTLDVL